MLRSAVTISAIPDRSRFRRFCFCEDFVRCVIVAGVRRGFLVLFLGLLLRITGTLEFARNCEYGVYSRDQG